MMVLLVNVIFDAAFNQAWPKESSVGGPETLAKGTFYLPACSIAG